MSHRPLQPTFETSTRKSLDSQARSLRREDRLRDELEREPRCHPDRGAGPPCGNPTPGGSAFDDASPASDDTPASLLLNEEMTSPARERRFPGAAFSAARRAGEPASDAPCRAPRSPVARLQRRARTTSTALASTRAASPIRGAFHRQVLLPACAEGARHRTRSFAATGRLPTLFRSSICSRMKELDPRRW